MTLVVLTDELMKEGATAMGGGNLWWSRKQLRILGVRSMRRGWKDRLIGQERTEGAVALFLSLRGIPDPKRKPHVKTKSPWTTNKDGTKATRKAPGKVTLRAYKSRPDRYIWAAYSNGRTLYSDNAFPTLDSACHDAERSFGIPVSFLPGRQTRK